MGKKKIILFLILLLLGIIFIPGYLRIRKLAWENRSLEQEIAQIELENKRLKEEYERLKSDPIYLEQVAREKLGVVREGEVIYQVLPSEED